MSIILPISLGLVSGIIVTSACYPAIKYIRSLSPAVNNAKLKLVACQLIIGIISMAIPFAVFILISDTLACILSYILAGSIGVVFINKKLGPVQHDAS